MTYACHSLDWCNGSILGSQPRGTGSISRIEYMDLLLIILGIILLLYPATVLLCLIGILLYHILANNWHEYLVWPFIIGSTGVGVWLILLGVGIL